MIQWPSLLGGGNRLVGWLNAVLLRCRASEIVQVVGNGRLVETSMGKIIEVYTTRPGTGANPTSGMVFKGLWNNTLTYDSQNVVFYAPAGGSSGAYIAMEDSIPPGTAPDSGGIYWSAWPYPPAGMWG